MNQVRVRMCVHGYVHANVYTVVYWLFSIVLRGVGTTHWFQNDDDAYTVT